MIESLKKYIQQFISLKDEELDAIEKIATPKTLNKKELFIAAQEVSNKILFFDDGYFRFFHIDTSGNEITSDFYFAPGFITSYTSFITGMPSFVNVQAMEKMNILEIKKSDLEQLYTKYKNFERLGRLIAESVAINSERHLFLLLNQPADVRYKNLVEKHPQLLQNVPLQYIASYLGITQETLSRMRKQIQ